MYCVRYSECMFVTLFIQHAILMCRLIFVICGLSGPTMFFDIVSETARPSEKLLITKCVKLLNTKCVFRFSVFFYGVCLILRIIKRGS
jgi:hypothetical protein